MKYEDKKYYCYGATAFLAIAMGMLVFFCFFRINALKYGVQMVITSLKPIFYGLIFAYLLNPIHRWLFKLLTSLIKGRLPNSRRAESIAMGLSIMFSLFFMIAVIGGLLALVVPQVILSLSGLAETLPFGLSRLSGWIRQLTQNNPRVEKIILGFEAQLSAFMKTWIRNDLLPGMERIIGGLSLGVFSILTVLKNTLIGIVAAAYLLSGKSRFLAQSKKFFYALFKEEWTVRIFDEIKFAHKVFGGFIVGKLLDSLIIGILCFIGMSVMKLPYIMLISVIVGVANIIPFFGSFIGAIPSTMILLLTNPVQSLHFLIFIIILQQFDGNILGPRILGEKTGISGFWVLFSILFFGGIWGFIGMVVGVPLFAVIYHLISNMVNRALKQKKVDPIE